MFSFVIFENDRKNNKIDCQYISSPIIGAKNFLLPDDEYLNERDFLRMLEKISNSKGAYVKNFNLNSKYQNLNISKLNELYKKISECGYQRASSFVKGKRYSIYKVHNRELSFIDNFMKKYQRELKAIDNIAESLSNAKAKTTTKKETTKFKKAKKGKVNRINKYVVRRVVAAALATVLVLGGGNAIKNAIKNKKEQKLKDPTQIEYEINDENISLLEEQGFETQNKEDVIVTNNIVNETVGTVQEVVDAKEAFGYDNELKLDCEDWTNTKKFIDCNENYGPLIKIYADMYGIDPNLAIAIASHERGYHSTEIDAGGGLGLYQIQVSGSWNWNNESITAYNFETDSYETYTIHTDDMRNVENNIKAAMMIFQSCLVRNNYNVAKAIQEYNYGSYYMGKVITNAANDLNVSKDYFDDIEHLEWLDNVNYGGDTSYVFNILKYVPNGTIIDNTKKDGTHVRTRFNNLKYDIEDNFISEQTKSRG